MLMVPSSIIWPTHSQSRTEREQSGIWENMDAPKNEDPERVKERAGEQGPKVVPTDGGVCAQFFCIKRTQQYPKVNMKLKINYIHYCFCK